MHASGDKLHGAGKRRGDVNEDEVALVHFLGRPCGGARTGRDSLYLAREGPDPPCAAMMKPSQ